MKVELLPLQIHGDERGSLVSLERDTNIPFEIRRVYYIFNTKKGVTRGYHAHKELKQVAIALKGSCEFLLDDGKERVKIFLNNPSQGLLIDSCIWREMSNFSEDCVLLILASHEYDESDYIRDYNYFIDVMKK
ncbi:MULTISPECIES: sugar 3,4-ketoisomerase [Pantoea]|uniref:TDP-4-oxo-6-deoxy-alpha-D-glucose-3, 4-oxoisomerase n=1 Tax=Pantoea ananas TaxID=553 RepID=A0AAJ1CWT5_PANAN|nr:MULTISPECIES: FdtA/QdtA family cupin domain-containing protein [Pantoea]KTS25996.1 dTDP-6-deoxy-3,4-keto-hexulose isomerase [Pantoea stewartii]MBC0852859.1 WxcM-like domain-containing protein [Pantoea stewartii]MCW0342923.1 TDP-4-oxo-6-deoxy-alpha-D-glucose-3,4-oxoisomerase [Pantoea ananatis]QZE30674.1 FdtA/QdtA family cupin domain-containing protein [Pantoea ananatis]UYK98011.1 FdtA/QdtA family cupin domain-containing protein [Pantoea stewartii]